MSTTVSFPGLGLSFEINRVAFSINDFDVYWYGIILAASLLIALMYAMWRTKEFGIDQDKFIDIVIFGTIAGVVGARVYYILFSAPGEFTSFADMINIRDGGLGFYGVVTFAVISCVITCHFKKVRLLPVLDVVGIGFIIGQSLGRWANFINQEAFGCNTDLPWGMTSGTVERYLMSNAESLAARGIIVDPLQPVHPTFLYESLWLLIGFLLINAYVKKRRFDGEVFLMFLAWNGAGRAVIEGLRTDSLYMGGIRISQLVGAVGSIAAVIAIIVIGKMTKKPGGEQMKPYGMTDEWAAEYERIKERDAAKKKPSPFAVTEEQQKRIDEIKAEQAENKADKPKDKPEDKN